MKRTALWLTKVTGGGVVVQVGPVFATGHFSSYKYRVVDVPEEGTSRVQGGSLTKIAMTWSFLKLKNAHVLHGHSPNRPL